MTSGAGQNFSDPLLCRGLLEQLESELEKLGRGLTFMEVCGTHTVALFRSGLRDVLPESVRHLSGPGCPVCVTHDREIAACIELAGRDGVIVATFGDLMRVPGPDGTSLKSARALGGRVEVVYSPLDALEMAAKEPDSQVVFLGVGFETTAPAVAATVSMAGERGLENFSVLTLHKLVPPVLKALMSEPDVHIDGFLLPGHVSAILGAGAYAFMAEEYGKPGIISGFEPADMLQSLLLMARMLRENTAAVVNQYARAVRHEGNPRAREILFSVFEPSGGLWRGIGPIENSGLVMRPEYEAHDAWRKFALSLPEKVKPTACRCGDVLKGKINPPQCPLFGKACTPAKPVGPCMVSSEGSCAAYFAYGLGGM